MAIVIVDCDAARRPLLAQCVAQANGGIAPLAADAMPQVPEPGTLLICHVGDRQHEHESRALGQKMTNAITHSHCILAGFTGGNISPHFVRQMPPQGNEFVVNDRASFAELSDSFEADIRRLVAAWLRHSGKLSGDRLAQAWIGYDPALEAILEILSDVLKGDVPPEGVDDVLEHFRRFGILDLDEVLHASVSVRNETERLANLAQLRDQLFRTYSHRGLPG